VCGILAVVWGGLYAMYVHSENYKEEQKRIEREQAQWSNANNVDIGKELFKKQPRYTAALSTSWILNIPWFDVPHEF